jgi:hypothetical protein
MSHPDDTEPPDLERCEALADAIVRVCNDFKATPAEVVTATSAIFANHAFASGVDESRALFAVRGMYVLRREYGVPPDVLISALRPKEVVIEVATPVATKRRRRTR